MKIDALLPSKYLKTSDIDGEVTVTVKELKKTNVARQDDEPEYKFVCYFHEYDKGLVLNATNIKRLAKALGDDTDDWIGNAVILYVDDNVQYGSDVVSGLRIKGIPRTVKAAPRKTERDINRDLDDAADNSPPC